MVLEDPDHKTCSSDFDCVPEGTPADPATGNPTNTTMKCGFHRGDNQGYCVPTWFGIVSLLA